MKHVETIVETIAKTIVIAIVFAAIASCSSSAKSAESSDETSTDIISEQELAAPEVEAVDEEPDPFEAIPVVNTKPKKDAVEPLFPAKYKSLKVIQSIGLRVAPNNDAERFGTIAKDTRVRWKSAAKGPGCRSRWIEIEPRGWICEAFLDKSTSEPYGEELPKIERGQRVPGAYGKVKAEEPPPTFHYNKDTGELEAGRVITASSMVRYYGDRTVDDVLYWQISPGGELLSREHIRPYYASTWQGTRLGDDTGLELPIGFTADKENATHAVDTYKDPKGDKWNRKIPGRTPYNILEVATKADGEPLAYRIGEEEWVRADFMKMGVLAEPPGLLVPGEKWFDIDLDSQVMIAYEGTNPVYATLVSTGSGKHPTLPSVRRIWLKYAKTDMADFEDDSPYSVAKMPWTQYYDTDLALHTAYWHDTCGTRRSHGCTNVAPLDARFLYFWSDPDVPPGWSMAQGMTDYPGSLVRVRDAKHPNPKMTGYAIKVEARRQKELAQNGDAARAAGTTDN